MRESDSEVDIQGDLSTQRRQEDIFTPSQFYMKYRNRQTN